MELRSKRAKVPAGSMWKLDDSVEVRCPEGQSSTGGLEAQCVPVLAEEAEVVKTVFNFVELEVKLK